MPGYVYNDKVAWRIFSDLKLPPYNGVVPSTVPKQVVIAIEKILFSMAIATCFGTVLGTTPLCGGSLRSEKILQATLSL